MLSSLRYRLKRLFSHIWVPISAYGLLGILAAMMAVALRDFIPSSWAFKIGATAIDSLLNILASSMLAVTTFSLSIMLSAFAAASSTATPRAFLLLKTDKTAQQVLASFIGAFIFSLVGIISLKIGIYGEGGRLILFVATILVLTLIVFNLVRWIGHLTDFGRLGDTLARVESAAADAMSRRLENPWLGARPMRHSPPDSAIPVLCEAVGHVQFMDLDGLHDLAESNDCTIYIHALPGHFVHRGSVLAHVVGGPVGPEYDAMLTKLRAEFELGMDRSFEQDPRFGMITLSEVASRALSPAVNDPGTAIDVIRRMTRVLSLWKDVVEADVEYPRLWISGLKAEDMLRDAFAAIARDGAALYEVQIALQRMLLALVDLEPRIFGPGALVQSERAMTFAGDGMVIASDVARLQKVADQIAASANRRRAGSAAGRT